MKALVGAFNQEKALVGAFSVIVQPVVEPMEHYTALLSTRAVTWHAYLELLGRHAGVEGCGELCVESVGKTKSEKKRRSIVS